MVFTTFKTLFPYLKRQRVAWTVGVLFMLAANYLDIRTVVLLGNGIDLAGLKMGMAHEWHLPLLTGFVGLVAVVAVAAGVSRFTMRYLIIGASRHIEFELRNDLLGHLQRLPVGYFDRNRTGDIMSRATGDIDAVRMVIGPALMYLINTSSLIPMSIFKMFHLSPRLTIICWVPMLLVAPLVFFFSSRIHARSKLTQELLADLSASVQETLSGIRVLKTYAREREQGEAFDELSGRYVEANMRLALLQSLFMPLMFFVVGLTVVMLLWQGSTMMIAGQITAGTLVAFFLLMMACIWPMAAFGWVFALYQRGSASMQRVDAIFEAEPEKAPETVSTELPEQIRGEIECRGLTFAFPGQSSPALHDVDLHVPAGTTLGITGPVGCGKSTLLSLLARRYDPPRGQLFLDGIDIVDWPQEQLREQLGIVDQEPFLFSDTIEANIAFGVGEHETENLEQQTRESARIAQVAGEIEGFPKGYLTLLGERGINLSGGQRQRTALARAIARRPGMLLLDDALSAVDTHTEEAILGGLRELLGRRTTLIISHRITSVSLADKIIYLEDGTLVEQGTHEELMALQGRYHALARKQQLAEEIEHTA